MVDREVRRPPFEGGGTGWALAAPPSADAALPALSPGSIWFVLLFAPWGNLAEVEEVEEEEEDIAAGTAAVVAAEMTERWEAAG